MVSESDIRRIWEELHRAAPKVILLLVRRFGVDRSLAEDFVSSGALRMIERLHRGWSPDQSRMVAYLSVAAINAYRDWRRRTTMIEEKEEAVAYLLYTLSVSADDPVLDLASAANRRRLRKAILELSPRLREVFHLLVWEGVGAAGIAARLGLSRNAVDVRIHRGIKELRLRLSSTEDGPPAHRRTP